MPLAADARFCPKCGRSRDVVEAVLVDLRPIGSARSIEHTAVVATRPPDRKRTTAIGGSLAAFALVAFGLSKVVDGGGSSTAATPTTSTMPTTTEVASTVRPTTTVAPTTTVPPTTTLTPTTSAPATTTTIPYVNQHRGVVLDASQSGKSIYIIRRSTIARVELATGRVTIRDLSPFSAGAVAVMGGRVVLYGGASFASLGLDLGGDLVGVDTGGWQPIYPNGAPDAVWVTPSDGTEGPGGRMVVRRIDLAGKVRVEIALPVGTYPQGFLGDRVVITEYGRIWTVGADAKPVPYAVGTFVTSAGGYLVWVGCNDAARCTYHLGTATEPDTMRTSLESTYLRADGAQQYMSLLAPDGATIVSAVVASPFSTTPRIVDLATGSTIDFQNLMGGAPIWTSDGSWLLVVTATGLQATNVRSGKVADIDFRSLAVFSNASDISLAVG